MGIGDWEKGKGYGIYTNNRVRLLRWDTLLVKYRDIHLAKYRDTPFS